MERKGIVYAGVLLALILSAFVVPYTSPLRGLDAWYGSFVFWIVFAIVAIFVNFLIVRQWRD